MRHVHFRIRDACDLLTETYGASGGADGRVSIEVSPDLAFDTGATVHSAKQLWAAVDRPNCLIKIPATTEGMPAITAALAEGISVNVTLIFGLERYRQVMEAYVSGLEQAAATTPEAEESVVVTLHDDEVEPPAEASATPSPLDSWQAQSLGEVQSPEEPQPAVLTLASGIRALAEMGPALDVLKAPAAAPFEVRDEGAAITVNGELLTRIDGLLLSTGAIRFEPELA